jgi:hypothetical protein
LDRILYSLLIPTRNRLHTAECLVRELLSFFDDDCEVVVQDCGDEGALPARLGALLDDPRLRYGHAGRAVSMTENWNLGFARCRGEYVTVLGDDDMAGLESCRAARWARERGLDVVAGGDYSLYHWPSYPDPARAGTYAMRRYTGSARTYGGDELLLNALRSFGRPGGLHFVMPSVYRGIARRSLFETMKRDAGEYFASVNPDIYSQYYLAAVADRVCWVDYPLITPGACAASNTVRTRAKGGGSTSAKEHLLEYDRVRWSSLTPVGSMVMTYTADTVVLVLENAGRADLISLLDLPGMYVTCLARDAEARRENLRRYFRASAALRRGPLRATADLGGAVARRALDKARGRETRPGTWGLELPPVVEEFRDVQDVGDLARRQQAAVRRQGVSPPWADDTAGGRDRGRPAAGAPCDDAGAGQ